MAALGLALGGSPVLIVAGDDLPGKVVHSWLANSFASETGASVGAGQRLRHRRDAGRDRLLGRRGGGRAAGSASYKDGRVRHQVRLRKRLRQQCVGRRGRRRLRLYRDRRRPVPHATRATRPITGRRSPGATSWAWPLREGELFLSDYDAGKVRVLATSTMKEVRSFPAPRPGPITVGADGRVWVIQGKPAKEPYLSCYTGGLKIVSFSRDGKPGPGDRGLRGPLRTGSGPEGTAARRRAEPARPGLDLRRLGAAEEGRHLRRGGRHLLRQAGTNMVRRSFTGSAAWVTTRPVTSTSPASSAPGTTSRSRPIRPSGERLWDVHGLGNWLDTACTDPDDENVVYTKENVFAMDWTRPPGREQSLAGLTLDRFKYPRDNRVAEGHGPAHRLINGVRRIDGKLFLFCGGQGTGSLEIYKFGERLRRRALRLRGAARPSLAPAGASVGPRTPRASSGPMATAMASPTRRSSLRWSGTPLGLHAPGRRPPGSGNARDGDPLAPSLRRTRCDAATRSIAGPPRWPTSTRRSSPATGSGDSSTSPARTY